MTITRRTPPVSITERPCPNKTPHAGHVFGILTKTPLFGEVRTEHRCSGVTA